VTQSIMCLRSENDTRLCILSESMSMIRAVEAYSRSGLRHCESLRSRSHLHLCPRAWGRGGNKRADSLASSVLFLFRVIFSLM
jgi:hypothetical protein